MNGFIYFWGLFFQTGLELTSKNTAWRTKQENRGFIITGLEKKKRWFRVDWFYTPAYKTNQTAVLWQHTKYSAITESYLEMPSDTTISMSLSLKSASATLMTFLICVFIHGYLVRFECFNILTAGSIPKLSSDSSPSQCKFVSYIQSCQTKNRLPAASFFTADIFSALYTPSLFGQQIKWGFLSHSVSPLETSTTLLQTSTSSLQHSMPNRTHHLSPHWAFSAPPLRL